MRENRPYGSEGGGTEFNQSFLPLSLAESHRENSADRPSVCGNSFRIIRTICVIHGSSLDISVSGRLG